MHYRRHVVPWLLLLLAVVPAFAQRAPDGEGWHALFDGSTLDGWTATENPGSFTVADGAIVVNGPRGHLYYTGPVEDALFENFVVEAEIMTREGANSGFYFHTRPQKDGWPRHGYEAQVNTSHGDTIKTGSLYGVVNVTEAQSKDDEWFTLRVAVRRDHVTVDVNDRNVVSWTEPKDVTGTRRLSRGTFAIQAHDPKSVVSFRNIRLKPLPRWSADLTRAGKVLLKPAKPWWKRMDYGPFLSATVGVEGDKNVILKGITVPLGDDEAAVTFDTELLRMVGWEGSLVLEGVTYNGSHGGHPRISREPVFVTNNEPGWSRGGDFGDPRSQPHGPLPPERGRYRGLFRHGDQVVFGYELGSTTVLEHPALEEVPGGHAITRTFEIGPREDDLAMVVTVGPESEMKIEDRGARAVITPPPPVGAWSVREDAIKVVADRTTGAWDELSMGAPAKGDAAQPREGRPTRVTWVAELIGPHGNAGEAEGALPRITDGEIARNRDDTSRCTWFDGERCRMLLDLTKVVPIQRVNTFTWHKTNRAPQRFTLWGSDAAEISGEGDLSERGWTRIATVDSRELGRGGKHGSAVTNTRGIIGSYRHLLWDAEPTSNREGAFFTEIDVYGRDDEVADLREPHHQQRDRRPVRVGIVAEPGTVRLFKGRPDASGQARLLLSVPKGSQTLRFKLAATRGGGDNVLAALAPAEDLRPLLAAGPALWTEPVTTTAKPGKGTGPYVVDDIPVPFDNPWGSYMRIGGFDFFSDGERAALCTWNGDVWVVSGLGGDLGEVTWKRYATGLFETLGLKIVDDLVYVNGKDQITRLHDVNKDGEADQYECFNNDVLVTRNFHEFTFDLQTDAEGRFYFSKAAPVRAGGRGFEKITDHHGTVMRVGPDGKNLEVYARGMRAPNGIGVGPNGKVTAGDNEGTWVPHCKLHWLKPGSFQGVVDVAEGDSRPASFNEPLCWFPMSVDNSGGGQTWVTSDRWGPFKGDLLHLSYGQSSIYKVMMQEVAGRIQGGVFKLPVRLASSAMRGRFSPKDGQLWVCGLKGWQTNAAKLSGFQRVRYTGEPVRTPRTFEVAPDGLRIGFTCKLDAELACDPESYAIEQWNYVWGPQYGSPEVSARAPDPEILKQALETELHQHKNHDKVDVRSAHLEADGRTVFLEIDDLRPVMQMQIKLDLESADGKELRFEIYNTINVVPVQR